MSDICYENLFDSELYKIYNNLNLSYVSDDTDDFFTGLCFEEVERMLSEIKFSSNTKIDRLDKFLLKLHINGISDKKIQLGLSTAGLDISLNNIRQKRKRCIDKLNDRYGQQVGLITVMSEAFKGNIDIESIVYD